MPFEQTCVGQESCEVTASNDYFATDPCPNVLKRLLVEAVCSANKEKWKDPSEETEY